MALNNPLQPVTYTRRDKTLSHEDTQGTHCELLHEQQIGHAAKAVDPAQYQPATRPAYQLRPAGWRRTSAPVMLGNAPTSPVAARSWNHKGEGQGVALQRRQRATQSVVGVLCRPCTEMDLF